MRTRVLAEALRAAVRDVCRGAPDVALAFSGGLDSSVLGLLAKDLRPLTAYTVGFPGSRDLVNAREASVLLGLRWEPVVLEPATLREEIPALLARFPGLGPVPLSFELPLWIVLRRCRERHVLAGQGADELFGGYARHEGLEGDRLERALRDDWRVLMEETRPREATMARRCGKLLRLPFTDARVARATVSGGRVGGGPRRKERLRLVAEELGLPPVLVERPKKAAQYGSGIMAWLKREAKTEGLQLGGLLAGLTPGA